MTGEGPLTSERPIVGVIGSGSSEHAELAEPLGEWIASAGLDLVTGGGRGVMAAVSRGFHRASGRRGVVIGVLPGRAEGSGYRSPDGYPNPWVELAIRTHLPLTGERGDEPMSRNAIIVLSSRAIVALPGGPGTASEARLARKHGRPLIAYLGARGTIAGLRGEGLRVAADLEEVARFIETRVRES